MKSSFSIPTFFFIVIFASCEKPLEMIPDLPPAKPFVTCYLTNTQSQIRLFYKKPISVNEYNPYVYEYGDIADAHVEINNGSQAYVMEFDSLRKAYSLDTTDMPILKGSTYHLNIVNSDGTQQTATTVIPLYVPPVIEYTTTIQGADFIVDYHFTESSVDSRYFLIQFVGLYCKNSGCNDTSYEEVKTRRIFMQPGQTNFHEVLNIKYEGWLGVIFYPYNHPLGLRVYAFSINEDMYKYFNSVEGNAGFSSGFDHGYKSPSPVYNNFEQGNGIFGPVMGR